MKLGQDGLNTLRRCLIEKHQQIFITVHREGEVDNTAEEKTVNEPTLQYGKAPAIDNVTAELLKAGMEFSAEKIHQLMNKIWQYEKIPESWTRGLIIKLSKKGNGKHCKNWRDLINLTLCCRKDAM